MTKAVVKKAGYEVGQLTEEGIYIGRLKSKDGTERDYFSAPTDAQDAKGKRLSLSFNDAVKYARNSKALGHSDWVIPTGAGWDDKNGEPDVLNAMFNNKSTGAFKATFNETDSELSGWYWSSSPNPYNDSVQVQSFSDGYQLNGYKSYGRSVRLVRSLPV